MRISRPAKLAGEVVLAVTRRPAQSVQRGPCEAPDEGAEVLTSVGIVEQTVAEAEASGEGLPDRQRRLVSEAAGELQVLSGRRFARERPPPTRRRRGCSARSSTSQRGPGPTRRSSSGASYRTRRKPWPARVHEHDRVGRDERHVLLLRVEEHPCRSCVASRGHLPDVQRHRPLRRVGQVGVDEPPLGEAKRLPVGAERDAHKRDSRPGRSTRP